MFGLDYGCGWCKQFPGTEEDNNKRTQVSGDLSKQRPAPAHRNTATTHSFYSAQYHITTDIVIVMEIIKDNPSFKVINPMNNII